MNRNDADRRTGGHGAPGPIAARQESLRRRLGVQPGHLARAVPPDPKAEKERGMAPPVDPGPAHGTNRILTIPNALSLLRILAVPLFAWLLLGPGAYGLALAVLVVSAITDWLDGKIARAFNMGSPLGEYLDPMADRLLILVTPITFVIIGILPWWVAAALVARDVALTPTLGVYRRRGLRQRVMYLGKAATFALMWAIPAYLVAGAGWSFSAGFLPWATALMAWGTALYLWTGVLYLWRTWRISRHVEPIEPGQRPGFAESATI